MAFWEDSSLSLLIKWPRMFCLLIFLGTVTAGLLALLVVKKNRHTSLSAIATLFKSDKVTHMASVELWVVLTTLMLVIRFVLDLFGPWSGDRFLTRLVFIIEMLNYSMVHYTLGLMPLSAARVNDYFQVWAVLLVTLQSSVKTGRPYSRSKQIPLLDLMSSFWSANLIRVQTFLPLKILLWLIWSINAMRIICHFSAGDKAEEINRESMRLTADYMSYEHALAGAQLSADAADPSKEFNMKWYKLMVLGEDRVLKDIHKGVAPVAQVQRAGSRTRKYSLQLDLQGYNNELVTVDKIWDAAEASENGLMGSKAGDQANQLKDVCLSFALYKLQRRRFYDLPIHEARLPRQVRRMRRLVFDYILQDAERAFRVMAVELSFLQDLFYSKHAALFANGFPAMHLVLSLLLVTATVCIQYPVHFIPEKMDDQVDDNWITHGVFITRVIVLLIIGKEVAEICMYSFSQWAKVLMLCNYVKHEWCRNPLVETVMCMLLHFMTFRGCWNEKIRQHNILISSRAFVRIRGLTITLSPRKFPRGIKIEDCTKRAIFESIKKLKESPERLGSYFSSAFGAPGHPDHSELLWTVKLEADTHKILVWHIATCLCEIELYPNRGSTVMPVMLLQGPVFRNEAAPAPNHQWCEHYTTAVSLSNYCAYLVTQALVPDSGLVARNVYAEVLQEINSITVDSRIRSLLRRRSMRDVFGRLMHWHKKQAPKADSSEEAAGRTNTEDARNTLTWKGADLALQLMEMYDSADLWEKLAVFWTGFLLNLAANTRASKHRTRLAGTRELTTHLWALLSHAGFLGNTAHGQMLLDPEDLQDVNPLS